MGLIIHQFHIEFPFDALRDIILYPQAFSFHFYQQQTSFNLTICFPIQNTQQSQAEMLNNIYYIFNQTKNEMLQIGYGKHELLSNDFKKRSHLMAQGEQTLYRIISGDPYNFPLPEIVV